MLSWIYNFLIGSFCHHKWKTVNKVGVYSGFKISEIPSYYEYHLECEKCGNIKLKKM